MACLYFQGNLLSLQCFCLFLLNEYDIHKDKKIIISIKTSHINFLMIFVQFIVFKKINVNISTAVTVMFLKEPQMISIYKGDVKINFPCHSPKVVIGDKNNFCTKIFFVATFFKVPHATGILVAHSKSGHKVSFFKYNCVTQFFQI